jgi:hypothetical protein
MNNRNINGPRKLPCRTPEQTGAVCEDCPLTSTRSGNLRPTKGLIHRYHSIVFYRVVSDVGPYQMLLRSQAE